MTTVQSGGAAMAAPAGGILRAGGDLIPVIYVAADRLALGSREPDGSYPFRGHRTAAEIDAALAEAAAQ